MGGRTLGLVLLASACLACRSGEGPSPAVAGNGDDDVEQWQRMTTVLVTCPPPAERGDRPCGLLADRLSPVEASARLADRYPFASIAEMRGTCGLDTSCEIHAREMIWLRSHNRNVAGAAHDRHLAADANRRGRVGVAETIIGGVVLSGGVLAVALGASIR